MLQFFFKSLYSIFFTVLLVLQYPLVASANFSDVPTDHPYQRAIQFMQDYNIVNGYEDGSFQPENPIRRDEFVKILMGTIFEFDEIHTCTVSPFPDVENYWAVDYVCKAHKENIIQGNNGLFYPEAFITLAEAAKIIVLSFQTVIPSDLPEWWLPYLEYLADNQALPISLTSIDTPITRAEMAEIIWRIDEDNIYEESLDIEDLV